MTIMNLISTEWIQTRKRRLTLSQKKRTGISPVRFFVEQSSKLPGVLTRLPRTAFVKKIKGREREGLARRFRSKIRVFPSRPRPFLRTANARKLLRAASLFYRQGHVHDLARFGIGGHAK